MTETCRLLWVHIRLPNGFVWKCKLAYEMLFCGGWRQLEVPQLPEGMEVTLSAITTRLAKWRRILSQGSYRGDTNYQQFVGFFTMARASILNPNVGLLGMIQRTPVDFLRSGHHWLRVAVLYLPVHVVDKGQVDLESRVVAFRLQVAKGCCIAQVFA